MRRISWIAVFVASLLCSGCTFRLIDFTVISSKNVTLNAPQAPNRTTGRDCVDLLLFIPISGRLQPNLKEAVDRAIEAAGTGYDALIDGVVDQETIFTYIYNRACFIVEGTPVNTKQLTSSRTDDAGDDDGVAIGESTFRHSSR